ncbi:MAG: glycoside hydrolase family 75 protein [Verrucomicrobiota bacterium]
MSDPAISSASTTDPKKSKTRGCGFSLIWLALIGAAIPILGLLLIDATNSGGKIKRVLREFVGTEPSAPEVRTETRVVEVPVEVEVEVPVEKIVEVERIVEVKPPMPSSYVAWRKIDTAELWSEIPVSTRVETNQGDTAVVERETDEAYEIEMTVKVTVPKPNETTEELAAINPLLPEILPDFGKLVEAAEVSPFFHYLYELKTRRIQENVTRIDRLLSRHNFYDCETVLQTTHPETGQKLLLVQGEMDVVSDGSDGDRWPVIDDYITMSDYYQPFTSYGWAKRTSNPNPLLARWKTQLKEYEDEFAIVGLSIERNRYLRSRIETLTAEIEDMEARSYLIAEADPFIVLPLSFIGRRDENSHGPAIGDYAVVIYKDKVYPAIAGDAGPSWKFGEASLRIAKQLNENASPYNRPVSDLDITYLIFPSSGEERKGPPDLELWYQRCSELLEGLGGLGDGYQLHQWEDLIAKKQAERAADEAAAAELLDRSEEDEEDSVETDAAESDVSPESAEEGTPE